MFLNLVAAMRARACYRRAAVSFSPTTTTTRNVYDGHGAALLLCSERAGLAYTVFNSRHMTAKITARCLSRRDDNNIAIELCNVSEKIETTRVRFIPQKRLSRSPLTPRSTTRRRYIIVSNTIFSCVHVLVRAYRPNSNTRL